MKLKLKKFFAYIFWPFLWLGVEIWIHIVALKPAWKEYRWSTKRTGDEQWTLIRGFKFIHNFKEDNGT